MIAKEEVTGVRRECEPAGGSMDDESNLRKEIQNLRKEMQESLGEIRTILRGIQSRGTNNEDCIGVRLLQSKIVASDNIG